MEESALQETETGENPQFYAHCAESLHWNFPALSYTLLTMFPFLSQSILQVIHTNTYECVWRAVRNNMRIYYNLTSFEKRKRKSRSIVATLWNINKCVAISWLVIGNVVTTIFISLTILKVKRVIHISHGYVFLPKFNFSIWILF
jgi:hypothetical protein